MVARSFVVVDCSMSSFIYTSGPKRIELCDLENKAPMRVWDIIFRRSSIL